MTPPTLGLLVLRTHQMEAVLVFYRALGLAFEPEKHGSGPVHYSCRLGATVLEIYPGSPQQPIDHRGSGATLLGFGVASLDSTLEALRPLAVEILTAPRSSAWGRRAVIKDPDGRAIEISEPLG